MSLFPFVAKGPVAAEKQPKEETMKNIRLKNHAALWMLLPGTALAGCN